MTFGLVNASYSLPKWQAVKMIFLAPCSCDMPYFMKQNVLCRPNLSFNIIRRIHLHLCVLVYVSTSSYLTQVVFPFFPRTHLKLYLLVHLIFQRIHLTPNYRGLAEGWHWS